MSSDRRAHAFFNTRGIIVQATDAVVAFWALYVVLEGLGGDSTLFLVPQQPRDARLTDDLRRWAGEILLEFPDQPSDELLSVRRGEASMKADEEIGSSYVTPGEPLGHVCGGVLLHPPSMHVTTLEERLLRCSTHAFLLPLYTLLVGKQPTPDVAARLHARWRVAEG